MKKRFIITTFLMLLFVSVALSTATYGWFTMSNTNTLEEFTIQARAASGGLEISLDGSQFNSDSVSMVSPTLKAMDVTSPDGVQFFKAQNTDDKTGNPTSYQSAVAGTDYYEFDLYFRTSAKGYITLDGTNCYVKPSDLSSNTSSFGAFSRDYIAGAVRVSLKTTGQQNSTTNVWGSDSEIVYNAQARIITPDNVYDENKNKVNNIRLSQDSSTSLWTVETTFAGETIKKASSDAILYTKGTTVTISTTDYAKLNSQQISLLQPTETDNEYNVIDDIYDATKYNLSGSDVTSYGWETSTKFALANISSSGYTGVVQTNNKYTDGNVQITKVTCRIWIEGQDEEAKSALALGKFVTSLSFKFMPATIDDTAKLSAPAVVMEKGVAKWTQVGNAIAYEIYKYDDDMFVNKTETKKVGDVDTQVNVQQTSKVGGVDTQYDLFVVKNAISGTTDTTESKLSTYASAATGNKLTTTISYRNGLAAGDYVIRSVSAQSGNNSDFIKFTVSELTKPTIDKSAAVATKYNSWTYVITNVANASSYEYSLDNKTWITIVDEDEVATTTTFTLTKNGTYSVRAAATGVYKESQAEPVVVAIHTKLATPSVSLNADEISWAPITGATSYEIWKETSTPGSYEKVADAVVNTSTTICTYIIPDTSSEVTEKYKVKAIGKAADLIDDSELSGELTFAKTQLATPTVVLSGETISWLEVKGADKYEIYKVGTTAAVATVTVGGSTPLTYTIDPASLSAGTYEYYVVATSTSANLGDSEHSDSLYYTK